MFSLLLSELDLFSRLILSVRLIILAGVIDRSLIEARQNHTTGQTDRSGFEGLFECAWVFGLFCFVFVIEEKENCKKN